MGPRRKRAKKANREMKYYAVRVGRTPGIYATWERCKEETDGFPNEFKSFYTREEAEDFMEQQPDRVRSAILETFEARQPQDADEDTWATDDEFEPLAYYEDVSPDKRLVGACDEQPDQDAWPVYAVSAICNAGKESSRATAGVGVFFGDALKEISICQRCPGEQTAERAELVAVIRALESGHPFKSDKPLRILTDSLRRGGGPIYFSNGIRPTHAPLLAYLDALLDLQPRTRIEFITSEKVPDYVDLLARRGTLLPFLHTNDVDVYEFVASAGLQPEENWAEKMRFLPDRTQKPT